MRLTLSTTDRSSRAVLTWPSIGAAHLSDYLEVDILQNHRGLWWLSLWLDFRFDEHLSWGRQCPYPTREEAACEAADLWAEGVRLVLAYHRGEPLRPPGVLMREAWRQGEGREVTAALDAVMARRGATGEDRHRFAVTCGGQEPAAKEYDHAIHEWQRATDWRPYRDGVGAVVSKPSVLVTARRHPAMSANGDAGQMGLFGEVGGR